MKKLDSIQSWVESPWRNFRAGNLYAQDGVLDSYGPHYPLARYHNQYLLLNTIGYSRTTSSHISEVLRSSRPTGKALITLHGLWDIREGYTSRVLVENAPQAYDTVKRYMLLESVEPSQGHPGICLFERRGGLFRL